MSDSLVTLTAPSTREALEVLTPALVPGDERVVTIIGRCTVEYDGRAASMLGLGDRLVILKPDGSLLVHTDEQRTPVNWQPPGCAHKASLEEIDAADETSDVLHVRSVRRTPRETVDIRFTTVFQLSAFTLVDEQELQLYGSEEDLRQRILAEPVLIEDGFTPLAVERETPAGAVDIYETDAEGTPTIVELKRRRVGPDAVSQLKRYVDALSRELAGRRSVRGILVDPSLTDRAERLLDSEGLEHSALDPPDQSQRQGPTIQLSDFEFSANPNREQE